MNKFDKKNIVMNLDATDKKDAIEQLCNVFNENMYVTNVDDFIESVISRENEISTGIGKGIAIPHGKSKAVQKSGIVVAKMKTPIEWGSHDGSKVDLVFMLAIEDVDEGNLHLRMLADISQKIMDDDFVEKIKESDDIDYIYNVLGGE